MGHILLALAVFLALLLALALPPLQPLLHAFDMSLPRLMRDAAGLPFGPAWFQEAIRDVSALGSMTVLIGSGCFVMLFHALRGRLIPALRLALALFGAIAANSILKALIARPRPDLFEPATQVFTNSFPSAHAMVTAALVTVIAQDLIAAQVRAAPARFVMVSAVLIVAMIGLSRIYLGVHWPSDVLAGWALGFAWARACRRALPGPRP